MRGGGTGRTAHSVCLYLLCEISCNVTEMTKDVNRQITRGVNRRDGEWQLKFKIGPLNVGINSFGLCVRDREIYFDKSLGNV